MARNNPAQSSADPENAANHYSKKDRMPCDVVMAGGVTSGLVYPGVVAELAESYSFKSIGGTSVGALMAAATAAAEYGVRTGKNKNAFGELAKLPKELAEKGPDDSTRLFHLFTADRGNGKSTGRTDTTQLMGLVHVALKQVTTAEAKIEPVNEAAAWRKVRSFISFCKTLYVAAAVSTKHSIAAVVAFVLVLAAMLSGVVQFFLDGLYLHAVIMMLVAVAVVPLCTILALLAEGAMCWISAWKRNHFGLCRGMATPRLKTSSVEHGPFLGLTAWAHAKIQSLSGDASIDCRKDASETPDTDETTQNAKESRPLTFGDLWHLDKYDPRKKPDDRSGLTGPRSIELEMLTSDISRNRSLHLPFVETISPLYIECRVLDDFFPKDVAEWMKCKAQPREALVDANPDIVRLPLAEHIPVVVAARLSLSFPGLLSAVPLLAPDYASATADRLPLYPIYLSDGGITSNFPVQLFDATLPRWPTFGINLVDAKVSLDDAPEPSPDVNDDLSDKTRSKRTRVFSKKIAANDQSVSMGRAYGAAPIVHTHLGRTTSAFGFLAAVVNTARYAFDYHNLASPGTRERIVHIKLTNNEGGLRFDMGSDEMEELQERGKLAGRVLKAHYDYREKVHPLTRKKLTNDDRYMLHHRWIRYRSAMAGMEQLLLRFTKARQQSDEEAARRGESPLPILMQGCAPVRRRMTSAASGHVRALEIDLMAAGTAAKARTDADPRAAADYHRDAGGNSAPNAAPRPAMRYYLRGVPSADPRIELDAT